MHGGEADTSDGGAHEYLGYYRWKRRRRKIGIKMEDGRKGKKRKVGGHKVRFFGQGQGEYIPSLVVIGLF